MYGAFLVPSTCKGEKSGKSKEKESPHITNPLVFACSISRCSIFCHAQDWQPQPVIQPERAFFLNGTLNKNVDEIITELGEPDRITEYAGIYVYRDFELAGMTGLLEFEVYNGKIRAAYWTLGEIDVDDYWPQINRIKGYFNKHYNQTDTWDWRKDDNNAYIVGITAGYYIRVLFQ